MAPSLDADAYGHNYIAWLARRFLDLSQKDELRQLIAELKYPGLEPMQRKEILEQMESILDASEQDIDASKLSR